MTTILNFSRDVQGYNAYAPDFPDDKQSATIPSGASTSFTVPKNYTNWICAFSYSSQGIWVSVNNTATPPAGATFASTNSIQNIAQIKLKAGDTVSVYNNSLSSQDVGIILYAI